MSPRELMGAADAALYEAKRGGRDKVVVASAPVMDEVSIPGSGKSDGSWS
jgi:hypothetical protein